MQKHTRRSTGLKIAYIAIAVLVVASALAYVLTRPGVVKATVGTRQYRLVEAQTAAEREKGLSGRKNLALNQGMLFVYQKPGTYCFWMKDMRFSIDMIWLGNSKQVLAVKPNVSPSTYPQSFCPVPNAKYVIELSAGQARAAGIAPGTVIKF
jgi:uncharacterized membrane protein (UPF0127 family)